MTTFRNSSFYLKTWVVTDKVLFIYFLLFSMYAIGAAKKKKKSTAEFMALT